MTIAAAFVLALPVAYAEDKNEVDPRVSEAMTACLSNDVEKGIGILAELYTETQDAIWVFNQARCYQQNDKLEDARKRFLEFRRKDRHRDKGRDLRAQQYVAEIDKELERREKSEVRKHARAETAEQSTPGPQNALIPVPAYVPPVRSTTQPLVADLRASPPKSDNASAPIYSKWWFWVGVGGVVAGSVVIAMAASGTETVYNCGQKECFVAK